MTTRLIIKGSLDDAQRAATLWGVVISRYRKHPKFLEIIADSDTASGVDVRKWFGDPTDGAPYPLGTLLFFVEGVEPIRPDDCTDVQTVDLTPNKGGYVLGARQREA